jgi:hypothetical protein
MSLTPDPIAGPVARIDRAKLHLDLLVTAVEAFLDRNPYTTTTERNEKRCRYVFKVHIHDTPPDSLPFLASEFVHNARAALDNIVWTLAPPKVRHRNPSFPLYDDPIRFQCEALPMLKGMKPEIVEAIEWCQPYHGDAHFESAYRLLDLNRLWNFDKHRAPLAVGAMPDMAGYVLFYEGDDFPTLHVRMGQVLTEGKEIAWIPLHPALKDDFKPRIHFCIAFVGAGKRPIPHYGLAKAHKIITDKVVPAIRKAL